MSHLENAQPFLLRGVRLVAAPGTHAESYKGGCEGCVLYAYHRNPALADLHCPDVNRAHPGPSCGSDEHDGHIYVEAKAPTVAQHKAEYRAGTCTTAQARADDPQTSKDAAEAVNVGGGKLAELVLIKLQEADSLDFREPEQLGLTGKELAAALGKPLNSITPRFAGLKRQGLIHAAGRRERQIVWRIGNGVAA